ncbi:MAG: hypothetical protein A2W93_06845 [Bacteroidetes bacterium GWF2_43_63]|nr:MAG: hypothetical protein A2W94_07690 [Bacteroidetes bacterium GWE2_42_42]OFY53336.1 MAG: hypothetical protein A2W93_06845 [Bacteroidetes bacterium GWF2_43_63]HBG71668.1 hypothetical protein [Bacteroidales bacterium]HCB61667.1 hypothetical protein [Bacteroidales bacterium]HCY22879.1 hypothetical protein [Bacteroidales bacterium]
MDSEKPHVRKLEKGKRNATVSIGCLKLAGCFDIPPFRLFHWNLFMFLSRNMEPTGIKHYRV